MLFLKEKDYAFTSLLKCYDKRVKILSYNKTVPLLPLDLAIIELQKILIQSQTRSYPSSAFACLLGLPANTP